MGANVNPLVSGFAAKSDYILLVQTAVAISLTGTTAKTLMYEVDVPVGLMGPFSMLEIRPYWGYPNSANNKILSVDIGPNAGSVVTPWTRTRTTTHGEAPHILMVNRGVLNLQLTPYSSTGDAGTGFNNAAATFAADFSVSNKIFVYGQLASSGETITLDMLKVAIHGPGRGSA
jgi:hypothetical protein